MKPIINKIPVFDATKGFQNGVFRTGSQIDSYKLQIYDMTDSVIIYNSGTISGNINNFVIPKNVLNNNNTYLVYIIVSENNKEYKSDALVIKCVPTPSFKLNIDYGTQYTLRSSFIDVGVKYTDKTSEGFEEQLNEYFITVTEKDENGGNNEVYRSDIVYNIDDTIEIANLTNKKTYIVTGYGTTIGGMKLETNPVTVYVNYEECKDSSVLSAYNDRKNAFEVLKDGRAKVRSAPVEDDDVVRNKELEERSFAYYSIEAETARDYSKGSKIDKMFKDILKRIETIENNLI